MRFFTVLPRRAAVVGTLALAVVGVPALAGAASAAPEDTTPPVVSVPPDMTVETPRPSGAQVYFPEVTATDDVDGLMSADCSPSSTSVFPVGDTVVTCSATDAAGNTGTGTFTVTVVLLPDTTAPEFGYVPESFVLNAQGPDGAFFYGNITATDDVDSYVPVICTPELSRLFAVGSTNVSCTATDKAGNQSHKDFSVVVLGAYNLSDVLLTSAKATAQADLVLAAKKVKSAVSTGDLAAISKRVRQMQSTIRQDKASGAISGRVAKKLSAQTVAVATAAGIG